MTIKQMFYTMYTAGMVCILITSIPSTNPLYGIIATLVMLAVALVVYLLVFAGGTHRG